MSPAQQIIVEQFAQLPLAIAILIVGYWMFRRDKDVQVKRDAAEHTETLSLQQLMSATLTVVHESIRQMVESSSQMSRVSLSLERVASEIHNSLKSAVSEAAHDRTVQSANMLKALSDTEHKMKAQTDAIVSMLDELKKKIAENDITIANHFDVWKNELQVRLDLISQQIAKLEKENKSENQSIPPDNPPADADAPGNVT